MVDKVRDICFRCDTDFVNMYFRQMFFRYSRLADSLRLKSLWRQKCMFGEIWNVKYRVEKPEAYFKTIARLFKPLRRRVL